VAFREGPFEKHRVPLTWTAGLAVIVAGVVAGFMLIGEHLDAQHGEGYGKVRGAFDTVTAPFNTVLAAPVRWVGEGGDWIGDYINAGNENRRLKQQLRDLKGVQDENAALINVNRRYEQLLNIRTEPPVKMVTARAVSESRGPFANARLIDTGAAKGVKIGNPVINEHGLVGRIVGVAGGVSRVLLLTDVSSKTPVLVDRTDARAILAGDGSDNPKLQYLRGKDTIREGDRILTSGDGGMLPRGLPIGYAAKGLDGSWRVKLLSNEGSIDFVRVLLFEDFAQLAKADDLNAEPLAGLSTAPPPSPELAAKIEALHPARSYTDGSAAKPANAAAAPPARAAANAPAIAAAPAGAPSVAAHPAPVKSATPRPTSHAIASARSTGDDDPAPARPKPAKPAAAKSPDKAAAKAPANPAAHHGPTPYNALPHGTPDAPEGARP
jgi:rod shape-determining protein MreC